jgi:RNA ligase
MATREYFVRSNRCCNFRLTQIPKSLDNGLGIVYNRRIENTSRRYDMSDQIQNYPKSKVAKKQYDVQLYSQEDSWAYLLDFAQKVGDGFRNFKSLGDVLVQNQDDLMLFKYSRAAQYKGEWTALEQICRGLILSTDGDIVAAPYFKFFNWNQYGLKATGHLQTVTEKLDGSLGIVYHWNDEWHVATGGSFKSPQALWSKEWLDNSSIKDLDADLTYMVEIIFLANRYEGPVIDYGDMEDLVLTGARNNKTGNLLPYYGDDSSLFNEAQRTGFTLVETVMAHNATELITRTGTLVDEEGWVGTFSCGTIFKFKADWYFEQQRLAGDFTPNKIAQKWADGGLDISTMPDEFYDNADEIVKGLASLYSGLLREAQEMFDLIDGTTGDKKDFAIQTNDYLAGEHTMAGLVFSMKDGKDWESQLRAHVLELYKARQAVL